MPFFQSDSTSLKNNEDPNCQKKDTKPLVKVERSNLNRSKLNNKMRNIMA